MPKIFEKLGLQKPKKSAFDLSHERKLSAEMGKLVPCYMDEVVPGDNFKVKSETLVRLSPMLAPIMHRVNVYVHYFFVPNRIIWEDWEDFITGGRLGTNADTVPSDRIRFIMNEDERKVLGDYLGLPNYESALNNSDIEVSQLPARAYQLIWNDYFRDQNVQSELEINNFTSLDDLYKLRSRAWEKDYFTSSLPFPQRGEAVEVPLDDPYEDVSSVVINATGQNPTSEQDLEAASGGNTRLASSNQNVRIENLRGDIGIDINELRKSSALQRWLEKQARGGARYVETLLSHFGVKSSDQRLQRPEYLGGGKQPIMISEVLNTSATDTEPQGEMAGHGISAGATNSFTQEFEEHGYVMGILSVLPRTTYQQGIPRTFLRNEKTDFYWPEFAHLGEQEVKNKELYYDGDDDTYNDGTFGYQQRYAEYKYAQSTVHKDFRTNLDFWHMSRIFENQPNLNEDFIKANPTKRIFAVTDEDPLWIQVYNSVKARRPMPYFANPKLT